MSLLKLEQTQDCKDHVIGSQLKTPSSPGSNGGYEWMHGKVWKNRRSIDTIFHLRTPPDRTRCDSHDFMGWRWCPLFRNPQRISLLWTNPGTSWADVDFEHPQHSMARSSPDPQSLTWSTTFFCVFWSWLLLALFHASFILEDTVNKISSTELNKITLHRPLMISLFSSPFPSFVSFPEWRLNCSMHWSWSEPLSFLLPTSELFSCLPVTFWR